MIREAGTQCEKREEVYSSCHCIGRGWKEHMFYGERPRPPLPRLLKPETTSSPRVLFPAPHQVVVLLIIAHEIILHVHVCQVASFVSDSLQPYGL